MKRIVKIISIVLLVVMTISAVSPVFAAVDPASIKVDTANTSGVQNMGGKIVGIVQAIGSVVAVLMLVVLGIKYMMGSSEEKAEYKKTMVPYLIGAILIFAASQLASAIYKFAASV